MFFFLGGKGVPNIPLKILQKVHFNFNECCFKCTWIWQKTSWFTKKKQQQKKKCHQLSKFYQPSSPKNPYQKKTKKTQKKHVLCQRICLVGKKNQPVKNETAPPLPLCILEPLPHLPSGQQLSWEKVSPPAFFVTFFIGKAGYPPGD